MTLWLTGLLLLVFFGVGVLTLLTILVIQGRNRSKPDQDQPATRLTIYTRSCRSGKLSVLHFRFCHFRCFWDTVRDCQTTQH